MKFFDELSRGLPAEFTLLGAFNFVTATLVTPETGLVTFAWEQAPCCPHRFPQQSLRRVAALCLKRSRSEAAWSEAAADAHAGGSCQADGSNWNMAGHYACYGACEFAGAVHTSIGPLSEKQRWKDDGGVLTKIGHGLHFFIRNAAYARAEAKFEVFKRCVEKDDSCEYRMRTKNYYEAIDLAAREEFLGIYLELANQML